jgi:hypothetical protein
MMEKNIFEDFERCAKEGPESALERKLIRDFLHEKGYSMEDVRKLPKDEAKQLMTEACRYAALKLAEVESRVRFKQEIQLP